MAMPWQTKASITSKLFSSAVFQELARRGRSPLFASILRGSGLEDCLRGDDLVADAFDAAFDALTQTGFRDEYVYRSALIRKILLGRHSLRTACVLNEFRVGDCKADLAILNGTSTVYEIKSERDSLVRLEKQLRNYSEVFARVYVVTADCHLPQISNAISDRVGIIVVSRRFQISVIREARDGVNQLSVATIFDSIRTEEAKMLLKRAGRSVPNVPNTELRTAMRAHFSEFSPSEAHEGMVQVLKRSRSQTGLSHLLPNLPNSLHAAALSIPVRKSDFPKLASTMRVSLKDAMTWG